MVRPLASAPPPASDSSTSFAPLGATSRMSRSSGDVCEKPRNVTDILAIGPLTPETTTFEGYGVAMPVVVAPGMAIGVGFENVCAFAVVGIPMDTNIPRHTNPRVILITLPLPDVAYRR